MMLETGSVVRSAAGRDKGRFLAVVGICGKYVSVCDGKERPAERPKRKNIRHIEDTGERLEKAELNSNRALRRALRRFNNGNT